IRAAISWGISIACGRVAVQQGLPEGGDHGRIAPGRLVGNGDLLVPMMLEHVDAIIGVVAEALLVEASRVVWVIPDRADLDGWMVCRGAIDHAVENKVAHFFRVERGIHRNAGCAYAPAQKADLL